MNNEKPSTPWPRLKKAAKKKAKARKVHRLSIDDIEVGGKRRVCDPEKVRVMAASMSDRGPNQPITVRRVKKTVDGVTEEYYQLADGRHRLEAAKLKGCTRIDAFVRKWSRDQALRWQLEENLVRVDLTVLEHANAVRRWVKLVDKKKNEVSGQVDQKPRGGRPQGGIAEAARKLPVPGASVEARRKSIERALQIAGISRKAKLAAKAAGLHDNQSALLEIADEKTVEAQVEKIIEIAAREPKSRASRRDDDAVATTGDGGKTAGAASSRTDASEAETDWEDVETDLEETETEGEETPVIPGSGKAQQFKALKAAWDRAPKLQAAWAQAKRSVRKRFVVEILVIELEDDADE